MKMYKHLMSIIFAILLFDTICFCKPFCKTIVNNTELLDIDTITYEDRNIKKIFLNETLIWSKRKSLDISLSAKDSTLGASIINGQTLTIKVNGLEDVPLSNEIIKISDDNIIQLLECKVETNEIIVKAINEGNVIIIIEVPDSVDYKYSEGEFIITSLPVKQVDASKQASFTNYKGSCNLLLTKQGTTKIATTSTDSITFTIPYKCNMTFTFITRGSSASGCTFIAYADFTKTGGGTQTIQHECNTGSTKYGNYNDSVSLDAGTYTVTLRTNGKGASTGYSSDTYGCCIHSMNITYTE